jgi:hypothetical protein
MSYKLTEHQFQKTIWDYRIELLDKAKDYSKSLN